MQIDRLLKITHILVDKGVVKAKDLADMFEVSTKTIYRDIDTLTLAGIPIVTTKGRNGGISILDDYKIDSSLFLNKEQEDIVKGLEVIKSLEYDNVDNTLVKIRSMFGLKEQNLIEIDLSYWGSNSENKEKFYKIKNAMFSDREIKIVYIDTLGRETIRNIYPLKLVFKERMWYLSAYCLLRKSYRFFHINRIKTVDLVKNNFKRTEYNPPSFDVDLKWEGDYVDVKLKIDKGYARLAYDSFPEDTISISDSGDFIVTCYTLIDYWFYTYLIFHNDKIEVLEPSYLKTDLIEVLEKTLSNLKK